MNLEMRRIRRPFAKQLTTCENAFPLFVLDLAGSANAPMDFSENSGRVFNMRKGMSPFTMFTSYGSSSMEVFLSMAPIGVMTALSSRITRVGMFGGVSIFMVRNL